MSVYRGETTWYFLAHHLDSLLRIEESSLKFPFLCLLLSVLKFGTVLPFFYSLTKNQTDF